MNKELESKLQRRCQQFLKDGDAFVFKTHGSMFTRTGLPDLVACIPTDIETLKKMIDDDWFKHNKIGVFVGLEVKRDNMLNQVSKAQEIVGREIKEAGGIWLAIDDSDYIIALLEMMKGEA